MILLYIFVALGLDGGNCRGVVGGRSNRKCWRIGPKCPSGLIANGKRSMLRSMMLPMVVSPIVVISVDLSVLLLQPSFPCLQVCRCELALAMIIVITSVDVGSRLGQGGVQLTVISAPMVV